MVEVPEGYKIIKRTWPETPAVGKTIVYWTKSCGTFKCEGESPKGFYSQGIAETLEEAVRDLTSWFDILDNEKQWMMDCPTCGTATLGTVLENGECACCGHKWEWFGTESEGEYGFDWAKK